MVRSGDDDVAAAGDAGRDRVGAVGDHRVLAIAADRDSGHPHLPEPLVGRRIRLLEVADDEEGRDGGGDLGRHRGVIARGRPCRQPQAHQALPVTRRDPAAELAGVRIVPWPRIVLQPGRDQDQRRHEFRLGQRQPERGPAAAAVPDHDRGPGDRAVNHRAQVIEPGERAGRRRRVTDPSIVVPDQPEPVSKQVHHRRPDPRGTPVRIDEHDRRPVTAGIFRPYLAPRDRNPQLHPAKLSLRPSGSGSAPKCRMPLVSSLMRDVISLPQRRAQRV